MICVDTKRAAYERLTQAFDQMSIIDTHEHLSPEADRLKASVDFATLYEHYCQEDFGSAGMTEAQRGRLYGADTPIEEKWALFSEYFPHVQNGAYSRAGTLGMRKFYGMERIDSLEDAKELTRRMREAFVPGFYDRVLKQACHLKACLLFNNGRYDGSDFYYQVEAVGHLCEPESLGTLQRFADDVGGVYARLEGYIRGLRAHIADLARQGVRGVKFPTAYERDLDFAMPTYAEAERAYNTMFDDSVGRRAVAAGFEQMRPLQNLLVNIVIEAAGEAKLPVVFHTGLQAGNRNELDNCRPERLSSTFRRHAGTQFVLLHCGLPWMNEAIVLAKYFPNVHIDLAWTHVISPLLTKAAIKTFVDIAPRNKLLGFGGDYFVAESIYGHLMMARENIADALSDLVGAGNIQLADALAWQQAMLHDNAARIYRI